MMSDFDLFVLPGGPSSFALKDDTSVLDLVHSFHGAEKLICAIYIVPNFTKCQCFKKCKLLCPSMHISCPTRC
jgi:hypothetical protein